MANGIYKFYWDCGRQGDLSGVFVASADDVAKIQGKHVHFGEVLGKHSDVYGTIDAGDITLASDNPEFVAMFLDLDLGNGYNPFSYWEQDEDEDEDEDDDTEE